MIHNTSGCSMSRDMWPLKTNELKTDEKQFILKPCIINSLLQSTFKKHDGQWVD